MTCFFKKFLLSAIFIVFFCSSCSFHNPQNQNEEPPLISLTDQAGRNVKLTAYVQRVVSCYYITSYAMMSLGISDQLVGIEDKADTRPIYKMCSPNLLELPSVGTLKNCNIEKIASLKPDIVLMPKRLLEYASALENLGIKVLAVDPETQESSQEMLHLIGKACNAEDKAEKLYSYREQKISWLQDKLKNSGRPSVYMCSTSSYMSTAPSGMYQHDLIKNAGGTNTAGHLPGSYWVQVSYEDILSMNPEVIIIPMGANYSAEDIYKDEQLRYVDAVKNHSVHAMPSNFEEWDSPIPSNVLGILWLATILHGDIYSSNAFKEDVQYFYETFYGFTPSKKDLELTE